MKQIRSKLIVLKTKKKKNKNKNKLEKLAAMTIMYMKFTQIKMEIMIHS